MSETTTQTTAAAEPVADPQRKRLESLACRLGSTWSRLEPLVEHALRADNALAESVLLQLARQAQEQEYCDLIRSAADAQKARQHVNDSIDKLAVADELIEALDPDRPF